MSRIITSEFVGDQPAGFAPLAFEQATEKPFSSLLIAAALHENINDIAVLIDGSPQILLLSLNRDKHFVEMPGVTQAALSFFQFASISRTKLLTPLTNGFIGDGDAAFCEELFDFTETEAEPMVQPDRVADNFRRKTILLIGESFVFHTSQSAKGNLN
jgi:hypothetical protein